MAYFTTLRAIREHSPCKLGWNKLLAHLGKTKADSEPLDLRTVLTSNGFYDTIWCLRTSEEFKQLSIAVAFEAAKQVRHLMPTDVGALFDELASGNCTEEKRIKNKQELQRLRRLAAAYDAPHTAYAAYAAYAAYDAADAALAAAYDAADAAAYDAYAAAYDACTYHMESYLRTLLV